MVWAEKNDEELKEAIKIGGFDVGKMAQCPKCGMGSSGMSEMMLAPFCTHKYCPIREWEKTKKASEPNSAALAAWKKDGGGIRRPERRPDGFPTRNDMLWMLAAERAIMDATRAVEAAGASPALTDAVILLAQARDRVADHVEGKP